MVGEWVFGLGMTPWFQWLSFALAGVVQIFAGAQFYRGAWRQLKVGSSNMDTLVALGSTTAFAYSAWALLSGRAGTLFHGSRRHHHAHQRGPLDRSRVSARAPRARLNRCCNLAPQTARRIWQRRVARLPTAQIEETEVPVSRTARSAIWSRCGPATACRRTAKWWKAIPPWTNPCSPANPCPWTRPHGQRTLRGHGESQRPARDARHRHRRSHGAGAHHRRRATRPNQPRQHPAPG